MSLNVRIELEPEVGPFVPSPGRRKAVTLEVSRLMTGKELFKDVYHRTKSDLKQAEDVYGLYWPERKMWIGNGHLGKLMRGKSSTRLEFRPKKRPIKIRFLDASSKVLMIDETLTVRELVKYLCEQMKYQHPEELSLVVAIDYTVTKHHPAAAYHSDSSTTVSGARSPNLTASHLVKPESPALSLSPRLRRKQSGEGGGRPGSAGKFRRRQNTSQVMLGRKKISKKHQLRIDTPWLDPNKSLVQQEVSEEDTLLLMYRFYYNMDLQGMRMNTELLYKQARANYLAGEMLYSEEQAVNFTALLCQITRGDFKTKEHTMDMLQQIKKILVPPKCKLKNMYKDVVSKYSSMKGQGITATLARSWFVKLWSSVEQFGMEFFSCTNTESKDKGLIGISKQEILFLSSSSKKNLEWEYSSLSRWEHDVEKETVDLHFTKDAATERVQLSLPEFSGVLVDCLEGHKGLRFSMPDSQRRCEEFQLDCDMEEAFHHFVESGGKGDGMTSKVQPQTNLTYDQVYWANKIENPLLSAEELESLEKDSWENPVFENMDQLMDERFNFLDFEEQDGDDMVRLAKPPLSLTRSLPLGSSPRFSDECGRPGNHSSSSSTTSSPLELRRTHSRTGSGPDDLAHLFKQHHLANGSSTVVKKNCSAEDSD